MDVRALLPEVERVFRALKDPVRRAFAAPPGDETRKADGSLVTALDKSLERYLAASLLSLDPDWGFVGEESGRLREGVHTWYVDPLDGTLNFARRIPFFASQAVLLDEDGDPLLAVVYDALFDEFTWAAKGEGAWREGQRIEAARRPAADAVVLLDISKRSGFVENPEWLPRLRRAVYRVRAMGSIALNLLHVATGAADAFVGCRGTPSALHDLGPGVLLVREAGGVVTDLEGADPFAERTSLLAAGAAVHPELLALFS